MSVRCYCYKDPEATEFVVQRVMAKLSPSKFREFLHQFAEFAKESELKRKRPEFEKYLKEQQEQDDEKMHIVGTEGDNETPTGDESMGGIFPKKKNKQKLHKQDCLKNVV